MDSVSPAKNSFPPSSSFTLGLGYGNFQTKWLTPVRNSEPSEWYLEFFDKNWKESPSISPLLDDVIELSEEMVPPFIWFFLIIPNLSPALLELEKVCSLLKLPRTHSANHAALAVRNHFYQNAWLVDCLVERFGISPEYSRIQAAANCAMRFVIPSKCCVCFLIAIFVLYTLYIKISILIETILPCLAYFFASSRERGGN